MLRHTSCYVVALALAGALGCRDRPSATGPDGDGPATATTPRSTATSNVAITRT